MTKLLAAAALALFLAACGGGGDDDQALNGCMAIVPTGARSGSCGWTVTTRRVQFVHPWSIHAQNAASMGARAIDAAGVEKALPADAEWHELSGPGPHHVELYVIAKEGYPPEDAPRLGVEALRLSGAE